MIGQNEWRSVSSVVVRALISTTGTHPDRDWMTAITESGENGPDGISVQYGDVYHALLRMGFWPAFPVGAGRHHLLCRPFFCDTAGILHLVVGQVQVWAG
jgi:hypothetical protein